MKKQLFGSLLMGAVVGSASAYQFEASGIYIDFDDQNDSVLGVTGEYHFLPVKTKDMPLAEAAFLGRSSNLGVFYYTWDTADIDVMGVDGEAYIQDFYLAANVSRTDNAGADTDDFGLEVGFVPVDGLLFTAGYNDNDQTDDSIGLAIKWVNALQGEMASNIEVAVQQADDVNDTITYSLAGDLYVNRMMSFGLGYEDTDQSNSNEDIELRARMFVIPTLSVQLSYFSQDTNDRIMLGLTGRF